MVFDQMHQHIHGNTGKRQDLVLLTVLSKIGKGKLDMSSRRRRKHGRVGHDPSKNAIFNEKGGPFPVAYIE
jgi:hypothetical protein